MTNMIYARIFHPNFKFEEMSFILIKFQVDWGLLDYLKLLDKLKPAKLPES